MSIPNKNIIKTKDEFINQAHEARLARDLARRREYAATKIQAFLKTSLFRRRLKATTFEEFDEQVKCTKSGNSYDTLLTIRRLLFFCDPRRDRAKLDSLLEFILNLADGEPNSRRNDDKSEKTRPPTKETIQELLDDAIREDNKDCPPLISPPVNCAPSWIVVKERLINLCLNYLQDVDSALLDSQHIDIYLSVMRYLISGCRPYFLPAKEEEETKLEKIKEVDRSMLDIIARRKEALQSVTCVIRDKMSRFRNDLRKSILYNYTNIMLELIKYQGWSQNKDAEQLSEPSKSFIVELIVLMFTIPGFIVHIGKHSADLISELEKTRIFHLATMLLLNSSDFQSLTSTSSVSLTANLVHIASLHEESFVKDKTHFVSLITKLLESCQKNMVLKNNKTALSSRQNLRNKSSSKKNHETADVSFNPIIGWLAREQATQIDSQVIKSQLSYLWSKRFLKLLFQDLLELNQRTLCDDVRASGTRDACEKNQNLLHKPRSDNEALTVLRRAVGRAANVVGKTFNSSYAKLDSSHNGLLGNIRLQTTEVTKIAQVCLMLHTALETLTTLKHDILTELCLHDFLIKNLWTFIRSLSSDSGVKAFIEHLALYTKSSATELHILILFCECGSHLISVLDDTELYEKQHPFTINELNSISQFLNQFVYKLIVQHLVNLNYQEKDPILQATHRLLNDLYRRDCRRNFTPKNHWLIKDIKISLFLKDLESGKVAANSIMTLLPHVIPHKERVLIFRKLVSKDKALHCTGPSTLITIHRSRLVEDGYQQLARLPLHALKGLIRVKFINDYGLDEAGLDQDGVFKEFLEDTIKRVFDPALNLFSSTSEQRLYPSPTSRLHEDHLSLFNFVGKMLGKAIYEGIVVDVPFATFFLSRVLGQPQSALYSAIDELPSLDPELYKSLTYIKHYEGDVSELDLTFSIDQDFMGKIETYELEPGGKSIPVTRETRVRYIHSVANFRMKTQIEKQTEAFVSGFKSIINLDWLAMFSASEFQRLISGDNTPIDLADLRKHTKYFGGFHNNHRVVCWLWDTLEKDFTAEEHKLFLKFVTSCSKPPLLGFANLEPPFTIRCVEVSDDQDLGDTVGSVLRGFFAIRRSDPVDRLPTSSTCFNLLKLPNYQRRSTLRDKLRYAIRSSPGFELS